MYHWGDEYIHINIFYVTHKKTRPSCVGTTTYFTKFCDILGTLLIKII